MKNFLFPILLFSSFFLTLSLAFNRYQPYQFYGTLRWDAEGYYCYLPAVFINHSFRNYSYQTYNDFKKKPDQGNYPKTEKLFTKYTCGTAILEAPFFFIAYLISEVSYLNLEKGYNYFFTISIFFSAAFYLTLGLWLVFYEVQSRQSEWIAFLTCLVCWLGTNLLTYTAFSPGYSHVYSFFLIALLIHLLPKFYAKKTTFLFIQIGLLLGLISLVRPMNGILVLLILFFEIYSWEEAKKRFLFFIENYKKAGLLMLSFFVVWIPQFLYWKHISGHFLIDSYQGETFIFWKNPKIWEVLLDAQNGLFIYAPLLILSVVGMVLNGIKKVQSAPVIILLFCLLTYICGSWFCWWFGGAYGHRPYIDYLPILALPLASVLGIIFNWKPIAKWMSLGVVLFLIFVSFRLNIIYEYPWEGNWGYADVIAKYVEAITFKKE